MAKRVPHCSECDNLKCVAVTYKEYYCGQHSVGLKFLGVDKPPKTSPKWCPKREETKKDI